MLEMQQQIEDLLGYVRRDISRPGPHPDRGVGEGLVRAASGQLRPLDVF
jgi:hypothetical protein